LKRYMSEVSHARERLASAESALELAEARVAKHREQPKRMMMQGAIQLAASAAAPMDDGDFEGIRALRQLRQPPATVQMVARCACSLLSVDLPGSKRVAQLISWDETKKVLSRTDLAMCVRRFDAARLVENEDLVSLVGKKVRWSAAAANMSASSGTDGTAVTMADAFSSSSTVGALFGWCSRILSGLSALKEAAVQTPEAAAAEAAAAKELEDIRTAWEQALMEVQAAEKHEEEERVQREKAETARREAAEKARREAGERARREAVENARRKEEEKWRLEAEEMARREAAEKARREAEERTRWEEEEAARLATEMRVRLHAEEKARRDAEAAEEALREVEKELRQVEEAARIAEQREKARIAAFGRFIRSESQRLERELSSQEQLDLQQKQQQQEKRRREQHERRRDELTMAEVLKEMQAGAVEELLVLVPSAGREHCVSLLEKFDWDVSSAACELLAID